MSHLSSNESDFDFWEFVCCGQCYLTFTSGPGFPPQIPFWLSNCGHVVCNSHLNPDQSCSQCGQRGIQVVPLQRDLDAPMSDWFQSISSSFHGVAFAARFQQETMASQIRYYKSKYIKYRSLLQGRAKDQADEISNLKKETEELRRENNQLRRFMGNDRSGEPSESANRNGKRPMTAMSHHRSSSPRSIVTPLGPNRLTIPANKQTGNGSTRERSESTDNHRPGNTTRTKGDRPATSNFIEQYAYVPPRTPQMLPQQALSYAQSAPIRQAQARNAQEMSQKSAMLPPPVPSFRPTGNGSQMLLPSNHKRSALPTEDDPQEMPRTTNKLAERDFRQMAPPPRPPMHPPQAASHSVQDQNFFNPLSHNHPVAVIPHPQSNSRPFALPPASDRLKLSETIQRLAPPTPIGNGRRFVPVSSRAPSRAANGGSQRTPFVPGSSQGGFR